MCINASSTYLTAYFEHARLRGFNAMLTLSDFNKFYMVRYSIKFSIK